MNFWSFLTRPGDNHDENIQQFREACRSSRFCCESHDFLTFLTTRLPISWFLVKYHSEMKCFFVKKKWKCLLLLNCKWFSSCKRRVNRKLQETSRRFCETQSSIFIEICTRLGMSLSTFFLHRFWSYQCSHSLAGRFPPVCPDYCRVHLFEEVSFSYFTLANAMITTVNQVSSAWFDTWLTVVIIALHCIIIVSYKLSLYVKAFAIL